MDERKTTVSRLTYLMFLESYATRLNGIGRYGAAKNLRCATNRLQAFLAAIGKRDISFQKLKPDFIDRFEEWLRMQGVQRNTSSSYMRSLHAAFNMALREGWAVGGRSTVCENPFVNVYCGVDKTAKRAVGKACIRSIQQLNIPLKLADVNRRDGKRAYGKYWENTLRHLELTRDLFIFSFCMRGMAFVDMAFLRKSDISEGHVRYARRKTHQHIVVRLEPMMLTIIERWHTDGSYVFPIITEEHDVAIAYRQYQNKLTLYNRHLKTLGQLLGGIRLTSYVSRHSWASTAHAENVPLSIISQSMGHDSERTTRIYLQELDTAVLDRTNSLLLGAVFEGKKKRIAY